MFLRKKILYRDWLYEWLIDKRNYIKESTYAGYSNYIYCHIIPKLGSYYLHQLNHKILQDFIVNLFKEGRIDGTGGLSKKTVKDINIVIKGSLRKAISEGRMKPIDLTFIYPKENKDNKIYVLSKYEQNKLTSYALNNLNNKNIGILLALYSGLRIGELCSLQWKDIDFKKRVLRVDKTIQRVYIKDKDNNASKVIITSPKTINANREIPINKHFLDLLRQVRTDKDDYVISGSQKYLEPRSYRKYFSRILKKNRIKHFNFHCLRHTFATNCISLGIDYKTVSELLGHANVNITLNLYVHPSYSQKKKCIDLICKAFQPK